MKKYCIRPFNNIWIVPSITKQGKQRYSPCCHYLPRDEKNSIDEYLESPELLQLQKHFLTEDTYPQGCEVCQSADNDGHESSTRILHSKNRPVLTETSIDIIEVVPSKICNLRCFMCNPATSSAFEAEYKALGWIENIVNADQDDQVIKDIQKFDSLKTVSILGGEFFLIKKNLEILDLIVEKKLAVKLTTNATVILDSHLDKLKQIKDLDITVSMEGTGIVYEFMRYPGNWETVNKNITTLKKSLPHASLQINSVIQPLNVQYIGDIIDYANSKIIPLRLSKLDIPKWLGWEILNPDESKLIIKFLEDTKLSIRMTKGQLKSIDSFINSLEVSVYTPEFRKLFVSKMSQLMSYRQISKETIREIFGILNSLCNELIDAMDQLAYNK